MITQIEALNYRCLKYLRRPLLPYQVLVGPNASGKTTFLDVISFLGDLVSGGLDHAVMGRTSNPRDLFWNMSGDRFELAVEAAIPAGIQDRLPDPYDVIRYEVSVGFNIDQEISILREQGLLKKKTLARLGQRILFPESILAPSSLIKSKQQRVRTVFNKTPNGNDNYYSEIYTKKVRGGWRPSFKLGPRKSTLGNLIEEESQFPASTWLKKLLVDGVQSFVLNSLLIRKPSPPGQTKAFKTDGSNLPWVIERLKEKHHEAFHDWLLHLQTALPDLRNIETVLREEDYSRYVVVCYTNGVKVPSWLVSDGTLRLMALTLPAYLPDFEGVYLIEEPENGIHPRAVETLIQSLSSVYKAQVLVATHSPVILGLTSPAKVLCFAKNETGATDVVSGDEHPALRDWKGHEDLGVLFASGVLG